MDGVVYENLGQPILLLVIQTVRKQKLAQRTVLPDQTTGRWEQLLLPYWHPRVLEARSPKRIAAVSGMTANPYTLAMSVLRCGHVLRFNLVTGLQRSSEVRFGRKVYTRERIVDCRQNASDRCIGNSQGI